MMKASTLCCAVVAALAAAVVGAGARPRAAPTSRLEPAPIHRLDAESLQRGARNFVNYCLNCHSAKYMRYNRLTDSASPSSRSSDNLMFATDKIGDTMKVAMRPADAKAWFGAAPPDLVGRVARARRATGSTTTSSAFYRDDAAGDRLEQPRVPERRHAARAVGARRARNQLVTHEFDDHDEAQARGDRRQGPRRDRAAARTTSVVVQTLDVDAPGTMTPVEYQRDGRRPRQLSGLHGRAVEEPADQHRHRRAAVTSACCSCFAYWLKREYWKDVH